LTALEIQPASGFPGNLLLITVEDAADLSGSDVVKIKSETQTAFGIKTYFQFYACIEGRRCLPCFFQSLLDRGVRRGAKGHSSPGTNHWGVLKILNNVTSTFFNTIHLLPKDLRFERGGDKLASCPGRHLTSVRPCFRSECIKLNVITFFRFKISNEPTFSCQSREMRYNQVKGQGIGGNTAKFTF